jgi:hypothetical protein
MQRLDVNHLLAHGSMADLAELARAQALVQPGPGLDADVFLKKAEAWAYQAYFLSTLNEVEETRGRFAVAPVDALVMNFLEERVAPSNRLPTGHLYEPAIHEAMDRLAGMLEGEWADEAADVLDVLDRDLELRDYLLQRRLEHFFS